MEPGRHRTEQVKDDDTDSVNRHLSRTRPTLTSLPSNVVNKFLKGISLGPKSQIKEKEIEQICDFPLESGKDLQEFLKLLETEKCGGRLKKKEVGELETDFNKVVNVSQSYNGHFWFVFVDGMSQIYRFTVRTKQGESYLYVIYVVVVTLYSKKR